MTDQQTIDWLQARLTSAEDLTLSQTRFMAQMTIKMSNLEAENERLRFHLKNMVELADEFTPEEPDDYASDLRDIAEARAALQPKDEK